MNIRKKQFEEGLNETRYNIEIFKDEKTGDLLYRGPRGQKFFISLSETSSRKIENSINGKIIGTMTFVLGERLSSVSFNYTLFGGLDVEITSDYLSPGTYMLTASKPIFTGAFVGIGYGVNTGLFIHQIVSSTKILVQFHIDGTLDNFSEFSPASILIETI